MVFARVVPAGARRCTDQTRGVRTDGDAGPPLLRVPGPMQLAPSRVGERDSRPAHECSQQIGRTSKPSARRTTKNRPRGAGMPSRPARLKHVSHRFRLNSGDLPSTASGGGSSCGRGNSESGAVGVRAMPCSPARPARRTGTKLPGGTRRHVALNSSSHAGFVLSCSRMSSSRPRSKKTSGPVSRQGSRSRGASSSLPKERSSFV